MEINTRRAGQGYEHEHKPPTIADPICPICGRVRLANYQMTLQANPNLALRRVERACDCTVIVRPTALARLVLLNALWRQFAVAALGHRRLSVKAPTAAEDRRLQHR